MWETSSAAPTGTTRTPRSRPPFQGPVRALLLLRTLLIAIVGCSLPATGGSKQYAEERKRMVAVQIEARGVEQKKVLEAMSEVERHLFVPQAMRSRAYDDHPLPIGHGQTISQPYIVAAMTEAAGLSGHERVLEIGTGSGYQAAVLARIVRQVFTIEIVPELGNEATERLATLGYKNVVVRIGDGYKGWPEKAPFDAIVVTAAPEKIPEQLVRQLKVGGRMILPVGPSGRQELIRITRTAEGTRREKLMDVRFVPMVPGKKD